MLNLIGTGEMQTKATVRCYYVPRMAKMKKK